jgi:hypothetical protein
MFGLKNLISLFLLVVLCQSFEPDVSHCVPSLDSCNASCLDENLLQVENLEVLSRADNNANTCVCYFESTLRELSGSTEGRVPIDLQILLDATFSMSSSIEALKAAFIDMIDNIVTEVRNQVGFEAELRVGVVAYRDPNESTPSEHKVFSTLLNEVEAFINTIRPINGGQIPEDVNGGLRIILDQDWQAEQRFIVHISDAVGKPGVFQGGKWILQDQPDEDGLHWRTLFEEINSKRINYIFGRLTNHVQTTDDMIAKFDTVYAVNDAGQVSTPAEASIDVLELENKNAAQIAQVFTTELVSKIVSRVLTRKVEQTLAVWPVCATTASPTLAPVEVDNELWNYCVSWGDPHIITFSQRTFDDVAQDGNRLLFRVADTISVTTSQRRNIWNHKATITGFTIEFGGQSFTYTREDSTSGRALVSPAVVKELFGAESYSEWPRSRFPGEFKNMVTFPGFPGFAFFWSHKGNFRNGGYFNVGIRYIGDLDSVSGQCGNNPVATEEPNPTPPTCSLLNECCSRFEVLFPELVLNCKTDYKEECCDKAGAKSTCCDDMSPPDCTVVGCGHNEKCDSKSRVCVSLTDAPSLTPTISTTSVSENPKSTYCVSWGDPHIVTLLNDRFDDIASDGERLFFKAAGVSVTTSQLRGVYAPNLNAVNVGLKIEASGLVGTVTPTSVDIPAPMILTSGQSWRRSQYPTTFQRMVTFPTIPEVAVFFTVVGNKRLEVGVRFTGNVTQVEGQCGPNYEGPKQIPSNPETCAALDTCCNRFQNDPFNPHLLVNCKTDYKEVCCPNGSADCCAEMIPEPCSQTGCETGSRCNADTQLCTPICTDGYDKLPGNPALGKGCAESTITCLHQNSDCLAECESANCAWYSNDLPGFHGMCVLGSQDRPLNEFTPSAGSYCRQPGPMPATTLPPTNAPVSLTDKNYCVSWGDPHIIRDDNSRFNDVRENGMRTFFEFGNIQIRTFQKKNVINGNAVNIAFEVVRDGSIIFHYSTAQRTSLALVEATPLFNYESYLQWPRCRYPTVFENMIQISSDITLFWHHKRPDINFGYIDLGVRYSAPMTIIGGQCGRDYPTSQPTDTPQETCTALEQCCSQFANNPFQPTLEEDCKLDTHSFCCGTANWRDHYDECCGMVKPDPCEKTGCGPQETCERGICRPLTPHPTFAPTPAISHPDDISEYDYCVSWGDPHIIRFDQTRFDDLRTNGVRTLFNWGLDDLHKLKVETTQQKNIFNANAVNVKIQVIKIDGATTRVLTIDRNSEGTTVHIDSLDIETDAGRTALSTFGKIHRIGGALSYDQWPRSRYPTRFDYMITVDGYENTVAVFFTHHFYPQHSNGWFDTGVRFLGNTNEVFGQCGNNPITTENITPQNTCAASVQCCNQFRNAPFGEILEMNCLVDYHDECCVEGTHDCCSPMRPDSCEETGCDDRFERCNTETKMCETKTPHPTLAPSEAIPANSCLAYDCAAEATRLGKTHTHGWVDPFGQPDWVHGLLAASRTTSGNDDDFEHCCVLRNVGVDRFLQPGKVCLTIDPATLVRFDHPDTPGMPPAWCPPSPRGAYDCGLPVTPDSPHMAKAGSQCVSKADGTPTCLDGFNGLNHWETCATVDGKFGFCGTCNVNECRCLKVEDANLKGSVGEFDDVCYSRDDSGYWCYTAPGACADGVAATGDMSAYEISHTACDRGEGDAWEDKQDPTTNGFPEGTMPKVIPTQSCTSSAGDCNDMIDEDALTILEVEQGHVMTLTLEHEIPIFGFRLVSQGIKVFKAEFDDNTEQYFTVKPEDDNLPTYYRLHPVPMSRTVKITVVTIRTSRRHLTTPAQTAAKRCSNLPGAPGCVSWKKFDVVAFPCIVIPGLPIAINPCPSNTCQSMVCWTDPNSSQQLCRDDTANFAAVNTPCGTGTNVCDGNGSCGNPAACAEYLTDSGLASCPNNGILSPTAFCHTDTCDAIADAHCCVKATCENTNMRATCIAEDRPEFNALSTIDCVDSTGAPSATCLVETCCDEKPLCNADPRLGGLPFDGCDANEPLIATAFCGRQCTKQKCCEPPMTCGRFGFTQAMCDPNRTLMPNQATKTCTGTTCVEDDCCSDIVTCHTVPLVGGGTGTFSGCPANRELVPASPSVHCDSTTCSVAKCCQPAKSCQEANFMGHTGCPANRVPFSNLANHFCQNSIDCEVDDCCEPAPTCAGFGGCGLNRELRNNPGDITCPGTSCTADVCCGPVKTCGFGFVCGANRRRKPADTQCDSLTCAQDKCCHPAETCASPGQTVDCGTSRLPKANPASQICTTVNCNVDDCCTAQKTCAGYSCPVTTTPLANPSQRICGSAAAPGVCQDSQCCSAPATCGSFPCAANRETFPATKPCAGATCTIAECCKPAQTCATGFGTCPSGSAKPNPAMITCAGLTCQASDCCKQSCSQFQAATCSAQNKVLDPSAQCASFPCVSTDASTCCQQPTCANTGHTCSNIPSGRTLIDNPSGKVCASRTCTATECCKPAWNPWRPFGRCVPLTGSCGEGKKIATRQCIGGTAAQCPGPETKEERCHIPCNPERSICISWGDPHVIPFYEHRAGHMVHADCGNCGYQKNVWAKYFQGTKNGKTILIEMKHSSGSPPVILDSRVYINNVKVFQYLQHFNAKTCITSQCSFTSVSEAYGRMSSVKFHLIFTEFPEIKMMFEQNHVRTQGIQYFGPDGVKSNDYSAKSGLCCHGGRCSSRRNLAWDDMSRLSRRELASFDNVSPISALSPSFVPATCPRQDTCCQIYRNDDALYNACLTDALTSCCQPGDPSFISGDRCCVNDLSLGTVCSTDAECAAFGQECINGLCSDSISGVDVCQGSWSEYSECDASCGHGTKTRTYSVTADRQTSSGIPCPYDDGYVDERQCTRGPCGDVCEGMDCTVASGVSECLFISTGTCVDVSTQFSGIKRAICQYQNKPDGTVCDDGICRSGVCEFNLPVATTTSSTALPSTTTTETTALPSTTTTKSTELPSTTTTTTESTDLSSSTSNSEKTYKTEFQATLAALCVVLLLGLVYGAFSFCSSEPSTPKTVEDVELAKRFPDYQTPKLPVGTPTGAGSLETHKFPVIEDVDTTGTQYSAIDFKNNESEMNANFNKL